MKKAIFLFVCLFVLNVHSYSIATGTYVNYFNEIQTNVRGDTKKFEINPFVSYSTQFQISAKNYFLPEIGYAYFLISPKNIRREMIFLKYNFGYVVSDKLLFRYGISSHSYRIIGSGGSQTLGNGSGRTKFPSLNKTVTSNFSTVDFGFEYFVGGKKNSIRYDLNIMNIANSSNNSLNYLLTYNWYL
jgi:hypothetical protein